MFNELMEMCTPPGAGKAYYRPLLCKSQQEKIPVFLVGINPATPIYPEQKNIEEYLNLILNYDEFIKFYKETRKAEGKTELSKTRKSIDTFVEWLSSSTGTAIAETNIIPYPTRNLAQLKKEPEDVWTRGKEIFYQLMMHYQPRILIVHGKTTIHHLTALLINKGLIADIKENEFLNEVLKMDYSANSLLPKFTYPDGKYCTIIAYQHFRYYGPNGENSLRFMGRIEKLIDDCELMTK